VEKPWNASYSSSYGASNYGKPSDLGKGTTGGGSYGSTKYGPSSSSSAKGPSGDTSHGGPKASAGDESVDAEPELPEEADE
jgi:hypothetical protein